MEPLFILAILALLTYVLFATLIGTWRIGRFVLVEILGVGGSEAAPISGDRSDVAAAKRVVDRMVSNRLLTTDQSRTFRSAIEILARDEVAASPTPATTTRPAPANAMSHLSRDQSADAPVAPMLPKRADIAVTGPTISAVPPSVTPTLPPTTPQSGSVENHPPALPAEPILAATLVNETVPPVSSTEPVEASADSPPHPAATLTAKPSRPMSEAFSSFMVDHNIRVVEIVAGLLIVVCSIGLVVSLWHTLVSAHAAVPSLIFMAANTSIFFVGFYTLAKWQLTRASRTVLTIATLLVPLGVLAGMAAAGNDPTAISLTDPITLLVILLGAGLNLTLLYYAGNALVGRRRSLDWMLATASPSILLPLMPTLLRWLGPHAGWSVAIVSAAIAVAWLHRSGMGVIGDRLDLMAKSSFRSKSAQRRSLVLVLSIGTYGLALVVCGMLLHHRAFSQNQSLHGLSLAMALCLVPTLVIGQAAWRRHAMDDQSRSGGTTGVVSTVLSWFCLIGAVAMLPAMLASPGWLIAWTMVFGIAACAVGWRTNQASLATLGTLPVPATMTWLAPSLLGDQVWMRDQWLPRLMGDGSIVWATGYAAAVGGIGFAAKTSQWKSAWQRLAVVSGGMAVLMCLGWSLQPIDAFSILPWWVPASVICVAAFVASYFAKETPTLQWPAIGLTVLATITGLRLLVVPATASMPWIEFGGIRVAQAIDWDNALVGWVPLWMLLERWWKTETSLAFSPASIAAVLTGIPITLISLGTFDPTNTIATASLALVGVAWMETAVRRDSISLSMATRLVTVTAITMLTIHAGWPNILEVPLLNVDRLLQIAIISGAAAAIWLSPRFIASTASKQCLLPTVPEPLAAICVASLVGSAGLAWMAAYATTGLWTDIVSLAFDPIAAALAIASAFAVSAVGMRARNSVGLFQRLEVHLVIASAWAIASITVGFWFDITPLNQLILATTTLVIGWVMGGSLAPSERLASIGLMGSAAVVAATSALVFRVEWFPAVSDGRLADRVPTLFVAGLIAVMGAGLIRQGIRMSDRRYVRMATALILIASLISVPAFLVTHPLAWFQVVSLVAGMLYAIYRYGLPSQAQGLFGDSANDLSWTVCLVGCVSSIAMTALMFIQSSSVPWLFEGPSFAIAWLGVTWAYVAGRRSSFGITLSAAIAMLPGPVLGLLVAANALPIEHLAVAFLAVWNLAVAIAVTGWSRRGESRFSPVDLFVVSGVCVLSFAAAIVETGVWLDGLALVNFVLVWIGGAAAMRNADSEDDVNQLRTRWSRWVIRGLCSGGMILGSLMVVSQFPLSGELALSFAVVWVSVPIVAWRIDRLITGSGRPQHVSTTPDQLPTYAIFAAMICDLVWCFLIDRTPDANAINGAAIRWIAYAAVAGTVFGRRHWNRLWQSSIGIGMGCLLIAAQWGYRFLAGGQQVFEGKLTVSVCVMAASMIVLTRTAHWLGNQDKQLWLRSTSLDGSAAVSGRTVATTAVIIDAVSRWLFVVLAGGLAISCFQWLTVPTAAWSLASILATAMTVIAAAGFANRTDREAMRVATVLAGIATTLILSWFGTQSHLYTELIVSMRSLVVSVIMIPMFLWGWPRLLGPTITSRWETSLSLGRVLSLVLAAVATISMFALEAFYRDGGMVSGLSDASVIGMGIVLGLLSLTATVLAFATQPGTQTALRLGLSDGERRGLIVAAQAIGALSYFHVFLCRQSWAMFGLAPYWPYIVFAIAMASVGMVHVARRRGDELMASMLQHTSLYLPLVPLVGFWAMGGPFGEVAGTAASASHWTMFGDVVSYQSVLLLGGIYYLCAGTMFGRSWPRLAAWAMGSAALWIHLSDSIGWGFLTHPQVWMLPPAIGVLILTHLERDRLEPAVASSLRYVATLVVYVTSTADMIFSGLGTDVSGPIILIVLSLIGIFAGIALQIRPFLYLGTVFILIATTSMVYHAGQSLDAVWPWWVFGITTGLAILGGLIALEKHREKLRRWSETLSRWEG